jgi:Prp8 binding protein
MDRNILLWNTGGDCANYGILSGHKSAILDLHWSRDSQVVYTASADKTVASFNVETGERIRKHVGHEEVINCLDVSRRGEELLVSGSDDGSISIWDPRAKAAIDYIETEFPVTAIALAEAGNELYSGSIDNEVKVWDMRMKKVQFSMRGHTDTITSLAVSPDGQELLSYSHDSTARIWDVRPFAPEDRGVRTFDGAQAGLEKNLIRACWDGEGKRVAAGGGDGSATVWDAKSGKMLHKLPGHKGTVNDVRISPDGSMGKLPC